MGHTEKRFLKRQDFLMKISGEQKIMRCIIEYAKKGIKFVIDRISSRISISGVPGEV